MNTRNRILMMTALVLALLLVTGLALADDGQMFRRNISGTPDDISGEAAISMMKFYIPAQSADGTILEGIDYYDAEGALVETREYAKPLIAIFTDDIGHEEEVNLLQPRAVSTGIGFGYRDAFAAISLDDGATWKNVNLSRSADLSSFVLKTGEDYPGDVYRMEFAVAGDRVLAVWMSRYCSGGSPLYTYTEEELSALVELYPTLLDETEIYAKDLFGVSGSQGSVDYTLQGFPEVGEIPYGCMWTARGTLELDDETGTYGLEWRKPERLTSGRRDPNQASVACKEGAGCVIVWQEDPEGLRPGKGLGPGEGWSGAIVNQKTDMWYTYIDWDYFDQVCADPLAETCSPLAYDEYIGDTMPKVAIPMAIPIRLSDNNMCKSVPRTDELGEIIEPYCYYDFETGTQYEGPNAAADFCAAEVNWTNPGGTTLNICQTQDGRVLWGRTGASRTRLNLQPYDQDGDGANDSAWVIMAYEELKAMGDELDPDTEEPLDIGKNVWYHSFDMFNPDMVAQGGMLNQPAVDMETLGFFDLLVDEWENELYETEISRRFNLMTQSPSKAGPSGTVGVLIYKQGIINQGGPADIYLRRLVLPETFDPLVDNPFDFDNMVCESWDFADASNPNYLQGVCLDPGINVSAYEIVTCDNGTGGTDCAAAFPWESGEGDFPKVTEWLQTEDNLDDQTWENPYDVAKGHRGFIDGDIIMMMYAWSPNWKANSVGNDKFNLYIRRSFDGGLSWTTTPASLGGTGTTTCENFGQGTEVTQACTSYGAGEFEQARNVSQLTGSRVTVLDPRYTPTVGSILSPTLYTEGYEFPNYIDDTRDPSLFFIVYETGDNTVMPEFAAVPLDLFYSRAYVYGDYYDEYDADLLTPCDWTMATEDTDCRWDWLENQHEDLSGEASVTTNSGGTFFYSVWNQWQEPEEHVVEESDVIFRRVMYLDDLDGLPTAAIVSTSHYAVGHNLGGDITVIGGARDNDHMGDGIVDYLWTSSIDGNLGNQRILNIPVNSLSPGVHQIGFSAQDGEGNWAVQKSFYLLVAENLSQNFMPMTLDLTIE